jgi:hypothetical protein
MNRKDEAHTATAEEVVVDSKRLDRIEAMRVADSKRLDRIEAMLQEVLTKMDALLGKPSVDKHFAPAEKEYRIRWKIQNKAFFGSDLKTLGNMGITILETPNFFGKVMQVEGPEANLRRATADGYFTRIAD